MSIKILELDAHWAIMFRHQSIVWCTKVDKCTKVANADDRFESFSDTFPLALLV